MPKLISAETVGLRGEPIVVLLNNNVKLSSKELCLCRFVMFLTLAREAVGRRQYSNKLLKRLHEHL